MGCCLSTSTNKTPKTNPDVIPPNYHRHFQESDPNGGAPPPTPPLLEEETVKEVLSETPIPRPPPPIVNDTNKKKNQQQNPVVEEVKIQARVAIKPAEEIVSEVSEVSEMCSFSESFSTTVTEKRDDDGEVTQRVQRSPAKVPRKRPNVEKGVRSPARRSEPLTAKRTHIASTSVQSRTMTSTRRNVGPPNGLRREPGEGSGRRSRSPATHGEAVARRPVRYRSPNVTPTGRRQAATAVNGSETKKRDDDVLPEATESLENPLVSMECFIFL